MAGMPKMQEHFSAGHGWPACRKCRSIFRLPRMAGVQQYRTNLLRRSLAETNSLRERQILRVIHRDGLPAHVVLPGVTAALAAAASLLFAAERAADLRAARAHVHVGDPAI